MRATSGEGILSGERVERRLAAILAADVRGSAIVKGFRMPARHRREGCTEAGVRKASREESAGEFATAVVSIYGDLVPVLDLICRFQTGTRVE
jgi:hypothetical protein